MEYENEQINGNIDEFYSLLLKMRAFSPIYKKIMQHLVKYLEPKISRNARKVIYVYFSLLEDGNTRISLDVDKLFEKWKVKWEGLVIQFKSLALENNKNFTYVIPSVNDFRNIFEKGINDLLNNDYSNIINYCDKAVFPNYENSNEICDNINEENLDNKLEEKLFIIKDNYLYANKYYEAKIIIEEKFKDLFKLSINSDNNVLINNLNQEIDKITDSKFKLNKEQLEAVARGINENIIITGGPGTGKTTVVLFILWFLLNSDEEYFKYDIYLTAPSGKAADRVGESLKNNLALLNCKECERIKEKLIVLENYTIHRLLKYNAGTGKFTYNSKNQFNKNAIFIIDEASMIDISMFATLLQAIPNGARVFILGDVDQLPSVDAGAVLGDLLSFSDNVVRLNESMRFKAGSEIGNLKNQIQNFKLANDDNYNFDFELFDSENKYWNFPKSSNNDVEKLNQKLFIRLIDENLKDNQDYYIKYKINLEKLLTQWIETFYYNNGKLICDIAKQISSIDENIDETQKDIRKMLWKISLNAKILCADKQSITGLDKVNSFIYNYLKNKSNQSLKYFNGQLLIITKNQETYKLYNGDTGVVITSNDGIQYLMMYKNNDFVFYPLSIFPSDSIENAFAITIHKSQGSEYNHILMFLPNIPGHRLLTKQIIYTGITRAKESVAIVSSKEAFYSACLNEIKRDTGIELE